MPVEILKAPYILLASPELPDPNFRHSVIVMGHHDEGGALGWIVNRLLDGPASSFLPDEMAASVNRTTRLRLGGPVLTPGLLVLHSEKVEGIASTEVAPGLLVCSEPAVLPALFAENLKGRRPAGLLVIGYSGWGPGQLEREMSEGSWFVLPWDEEFAFPVETETLWDRALLHLGIDPSTVSTQTGSIN